MGWVQNYANDVVAALMDACLLKGVAEPVIISESGRALASHSSVLVFDVLSASHYPYRSVTLNIDNLAKDAAACGCPPKEGNQRSIPSQGAGEYLLSTFYQVHSYFCSECASVFCTHRCHCSIARFDN